MTKRLIARLLLLPVGVGLAAPGPALGGGWPWRSSGPACADCATHAQAVAIADQVRAQHEALDRCQLNALVEQRRINANWLIFGEYDRFRVASETLPATNARQPAPAGAGPFAPVPPSPTVPVILRP